MTFSARPNATGGRRHFAYTIGSSLFLKYRRNPEKGAIRARATTFFAEYRMPAGQRILHHHTLMSPPIAHRLIKVP